MAEDTPIYGEVHSKSDLRKVFTAIRQDVKEASSRPGLTELYKRAGYLITLTHAPSWKEKFGKESRELRKLAEKEFGTTRAQSIAVPGASAPSQTMTKPGGKDDAIVSLPLPGD